MASPKPIQITDWQPTGGSGFSTIPAKTNQCENDWLNNFSEHPLFSLAYLLATAVPAIYLRPQKVFDE
ncbi:MAG: hypothetical protein M3362_03365 [Acidobacteriota bacterium]|nr:hypothetical protein [Acidobacteriota bacterium]